ncbi:MAG TPA: hypothetical protein VGZ90_09820 [Puia sp.]|jgi:hypothetical protein|nr:hypothetical protein [Puia sp.]
MQRRRFLTNIIGAGFVIRPFASFSRNFTFHNYNIANGPVKPINIYNNWSSYDELSDVVKLTEELAMRELNEVIRLKSHSGEIDYYMMDAFWFGKDGGYRTWNKNHWPNGPDKWLDTCKSNSIIPGMWFSTNLITMGGQQVLDVIPAWEDSLATDTNILCLFEGGYLNHLSETLQMWANKGVGAFKFDFAYFEAATKAAKEKYTLVEIQEMNKVAFINMLKALRTKNPHLLITGYNGFGGEMENTFTPFKKNVDLRWLEVFDTLYSGDPRFSDVPMMNIWRSQDNYSDHMVRQFEFNGLPIRRIDNCAFMIGKTGTCYYRATNAWKGMLILEYGRGGWSNVFHGNLELLSDEDMAWFTKVQKLFLPLQQYAGWSMFGAIPGMGKYYGFKAKEENGMVLTIVNPSQSIISETLEHHNYGEGMVLYSDGGFNPSVKNSLLRLGPEQLVVIGFGKYANPKYSLGRDESIRIPNYIEPLDVSFIENGRNSIMARIKTTSHKNIRILFQQFSSDGFPYRTWGGGPPDGKTMDKYFLIRVTQGNKTIPLTIMYDKMIWSGLSWAAGEIQQNDYDINQPLFIGCSSLEKENLSIKAKLYAVNYE